MRQRNSIDYDEASEGDEEASVDSGGQDSGSLVQAVRKRAMDDENGLSKRRRRSSSPEIISWDEEGDDPIESADEMSGEDWNLQGAGKEAAPDRKPQRQSGRARRSVAQRQALVDSDSGGDDAEEQSGDGGQRQRRAATARKPENRHEEMSDEESEEQRSSGRRRPRRAAAAVQPNYRDEPAEDEEEEEGDERASEARPSDMEGEESSESEESEEEEEVFAPQRRQPARQARKRSASANARRSGRSRGRVNYNEEAMLGHVGFEEEEEEDEEDEDEGGSVSEEGGEEQEGSGPSRPARRAAKLAGRAIRQQAGGVKKRRRQPKRAAAPAKRRNVVADSESESEERRERSGTRSDSPASISDSDEDGSGSDRGSEYELDAADVERILDMRPSMDGSGDEVFCKLQGQSYRKARWLPRDLLAADRSQLLGNFLKRQAAGDLNPYGDLVDGVSPQHLQVDRIIAHRVRNGRPVYLVKWQGLGYSEATWEDGERDLADDQAHIERYERFSVPPSEEEQQQRQEQEGQELDTAWVPDFCNGRQLRDYQRVSLDWMVSNWAVRRNCILGDEMGLGKTAQSISVLAYQHQFCKIRGPFLIIAPLTTLGHWQREVETWTDMNCVVYAGTAQDRAAIQRYDLWYPAGTGRQRQRAVKPNVVLAAYETVRADKNLFQSIPWETVIIDEAHRMKSTGSSTRAAVVGMDISWLLLLTGTPVQNNMRELFGILNLLDPERFEDEDGFLEEFGDESAGMTPQQVKALQEELRPILLRRMKEDVETLPEKEEVIIWVELTPEQRTYYRAIYENEIGTLLAGGSSKNLPNMRNLAMELRKVCCHPFLCNGLEEDIQRRKLEAGVEASEVDQLVAASGKMVLLHKLLPKLKSEGRKVLIFSQFKIMLDVLEDYLRMAGHATERIDGSTAPRDRQAAIDRFSKEGSDGFVFLLSTRAGGQGITLTAADTCIIYDSDWNPQNDLQAMARCHRIGQEKEVTIYRLLSKGTYEENVFQISSRKYGLDEAILGGLGASDSSGANPEDDSKKIAELLKHGAHCLHASDAANEQSGAFAAEGIDQILQGRTEKRQIGGRAGNTFSVATFAVGPSTGGDAGNDRSYWTALLPGAAEEHEKRLAAKRAPVILAPRVRKQVDYSYKGQISGRMSRQADADDLDYVATTADADDNDDDDDVVLPHGKKARKGGADLRRWTLGEVQEFLHRLLQFGQGRLDRVREEAGLTDRSAEECAQLEAAVLRALEQAASIAAKQEAQRQQAQQAEAAAAGAGAAVGGSAAAAAAPAAGAGKGQDLQDGAEGAGEGKNKDRSKKAKDRSVAVALEAWVEGEMSGETPAVQQALRTKTFLDFANSAPGRTQQALRTRRLLATWVARIRGEEAQAGCGNTGFLTLPGLKGKTPHHWRGGWLDGDTWRLMEALHELGWVARRGRAQSELLDALLSDQRFGFPQRVQKRREEAPLASPNKPAAQQGQRQQAAASVEPMQTDGRQPPAEGPREGGQPAPAVAPTASPPSKHNQEPRVLDSKEWDALCKGLAAFINNNLLPAMEDPAPKRAPFAPGGGLDRAGSVHGSSNDIPTHHGQLKKKPSKLAPSSVATAAALGAVDGISQDSDATPPAAGKGAAAGPVAAGFTNPLTAAGVEAGSGGKDGVSARKPPLALQRSTAPKGGKSKMQQGIMQFLTKKASSRAAGAAGAGESPTGCKENEQRQQLQQQQRASGKAAVQDAPAGEEIVID